MKGFTRELKLSGGASYLRLFRSGRRIRTAYFNVFSAASASTNTRLGLAISKRYIARAVDRNRIKRIIRESFRLNIHRFGCIDIIVQANTNAAKANSAKLFDCLEALWNDLSRVQDHHKTL